MWEREERERAKERKQQKHMKILKLIKHHEPSKNSLQDSRIWQSVKTDPAGYQELIKKWRQNSRKTRYEIRMSTLHNWEEVTWIRTLLDLEFESVEKTVIFCGSHEWVTPYPKQRTRLRVNSFKTIEEKKQFQNLQI